MFSSPFALFYTGLVTSKDKEIEELKAKITEVLAVCPPTSFTNTPLDTTPIHYTSKLLPQVRLCRVAELLVGSNRVAYSCVG